MVLKKIKIDRSDFEVSIQKNKLKKIIDIYWQVKKKLKV